MSLESSQLGQVTLGEIISQPACWRECVGILEGRDYVAELRREVNGDSGWCMIGCGSSYYAAQVAAAAWPQGGFLSPRRAGEIIATMCSKYRKSRLLMHFARLDGATQQDSTPP